MNRTFGFNQGVRHEARLRQHELCACCGDMLSDVLEHAHHVVPNQSGKAGNPGHAWLASVENCVVVCELCHYRVHENGRYKNGAVAPPDYYPHSHARDATAHQLWADHIAFLSRRLWGP